MPRSARQTAETSPQYAELTDPELIDRYLRDHDERAFAALYERHNERLLKFATKKLRGQPETARDIVAETWRKITQHLHRFDPEKRFSTWAHHIAYNLVKNEYRSSERDPMIDFATLNQDRDPREDRPLQFGSEEDWSDPEASTSNRQLMREIREVMESLPPHHRAPMRLYYLAGFKYQGIAEEMGLALGTVKSRLSRARERFAQEWERRQEEQADEGEEGPRVKIGPDGELAIIYPEDHPDSDQGEEPQFEDVRDDQPLVSSQAALTESEAREIRERAGRELPPKGEGQWRWFLDLSES